MRITRRVRRYLWTICITLITFSCIRSFLLFEYRRSDTTNIALNQQSNNDGAMGDTDSYDETRRFYDFDDSEQTTTAAIMKSAFNISPKPHNQACKSSEITVIIHV